MLRSELTDLEFEILKSAMNLAKVRQIHQADELLDQLKTVFPDCEKEINSALMCWASREQETAEQ